MFEHTHIQRRCAGNRGRLDLRSILLCVASLQAGGVRYNILAPCSIPRGAGHACGLQYDSISVMPPWITSGQFRTCST